MATIRLIPSTYSLSNTEYLSVSNASNMYNNTDSTTYATVTNSKTKTSSYYIYLKGFNFDDIPNNAVINSFTVKLKAYESGVNTSSSYTPRLVNNTTTITSSCSAITTSVQTLTFTGVTADWNTIVGYGSNFGIRINCRRANKNTTSYVYIYGAEILVDYTVPVYHTVSTSITGGTLRSPTVASTTVRDGANYEITFNGNPDYTLSSMTVNGVEVTPTIKSAPAPTLPTYTVSTNYGTYQTYALSNAYDGDDSTFFWSSEAQTQGKYILITFSDFINLKSFSTYSSNNRDYPHPCNMLQVSANNENWTDIGTFSDTQTSTFSNITNANNIKYVRIYATSNIENWLVLSEITMSYESAQLGGEYYSYTISAIDSDKTVVIIFNEPDVHYIKVNGRWRKVLTAYRKVNGTWEEFNYTYDDSLQLKYLGHITSDIIGEVTTDYHIVITDTSVPNDTYYFYYEDANKTKLTDWDVIGSTEFNEYNGGTTTTGEEVGVINEDNSISLTNTSLATGTYTMYYENADGAKLEGWDSIGTVSK